VRSDSHGLSHALENLPPACFLPSLRSGRAFKSYTTIKKRSDATASKRFLAGAQGLELPLIQYITSRNAVFSLLSTEMFTIL
jgi:hypothetical protein